MELKVDVYIKHKLQGGCLTGGRVAGGKEHGGGRWWECEGAAQDHSDADTHTHTLKLSLTLYHLNTCALTEKQVAHTGILHLFFLSKGTREVWRGRNLRRGPGA